MRRYLLAAVAAAALASPATARDGSGYVGIEGGIMFPKDLNGDAFVDLTATPAAPAVIDFIFQDDFDAELKRGFDVDVIAGYDFGSFRLEGELGYKWADREGFDPDDEALAQLNTALNRPSASPDIGFPGQPALTDDDFDDLDGKITVRSAMANALIDLGADDGFSFFVGAGFGRAWGRALNDGDSAWAYQLLAGVRSAVSSNVDIGLKYRYFRTGKMNFEGGPLQFAGNSNRVGTTAAPIDQTVNAAITPQLEGGYFSHSLLASLIFNFGAPAVAVLPPPPPPPPPPATQTCPDGSVILATDVCPAPPPPPPPPPPAGERG